jgi:hypothetical protein
MITPPTPVPRNHHVVSQFLQRGFSPDRKNVVSLVKPTRPGDPYLCFGKTQIEKTAAVHDFNTVSSPVQPVITTLESALAKHVETPAANALRALQQAPIGQLALARPTRRAVCRLAGLLHANSPAGRERLQGILTSFVPVGGAPANAIDAVARAYAFDPADAAEVDAWREAFAFMRDGNTAVTQENVLRTTIVLGQMTAASMEKMGLTIYRLDGPPYLLLPDLPVLGWSPPGGDVPDSGSAALFPFDHRHLLVFDADASTDELRDGDDPRLDALLRARFPGRGTRLTGARRWATTLAVNSMRAEAYARTVEDVTAAVALAQPGARLVYHSTPSARGPGIVLR